MIRKWFLKSQLKKAGAQPAELDELAAVTRQLEDAVPRLEHNRKDDIARQIGFKPVHVKRQRAVALSGAFAVFVIVVLLAQLARPGTPLYAVKRGTEEVRIKVQPGYQEDVVERRKTELDELKRQKAEDAAIEQAKEDLDRAKDEYEHYEDNSGKGSGDSSGGDDSGGDNSRSGSSGDSRDNDSSGSGSGRDHPEDD